MEEWKDITAYAAGRYEVSSLGRIRNTQTGKFRASVVTYDGYPRVNLYLNCGTKSFYVHALVAYAFIGPRPEGLTINHKDGDKFNNAPDNLEYATNKEQDTHARSMGIKDSRGEKNPKSKLTHEQALFIRTDKRTAVAIAADYGIHYATVHKIRQGVIWKHI